MFKHSRCLLALIGALGFTHSAVAENWRIKYVDGTVRLANVNVFNFQGSRKNAVPDFTETALDPGISNLACCRDCSPKRRQFRMSKGFAMRIANLQRVPEAGQGVMPSSIQLGEKQVRA